MKILIGVCGIGLGHSTRQWEIAQKLIQRGHQVRICTFGKGIEFFQRTTLAWEEVWVPFIVYKKGKLHLPSLFSKNYRTFIKGLFQNLKIYQKLKQDDFYPDICISDYEPITARFAYKLNKPLVLVDQQSKFWRFSFQNIGNFTCVEEKKRLRLFFPKYDYRFITSFYKLPNIEDNDTEIIPTIIRSDIKKTPKYTKHPQIHLVVYLSEYGGTSIKQTSDEWKEELASIPNVFFTIFDAAVKAPRKNGNLEIRPFDRTDFAESLKVADGVITTAGHTLLSECLYLGLPIYVIPLGTFDQHYCANFIQDNQLGISSYTITKKECLDFIARLDHWKSNIKNCDNILTSSDSVQMIVDFLEDHYEKTGDKCG
ncbi:hypothetical protein MK805_15440 [Shimazuella sp. AN120528]|uniref:glycosyltransferase family protein n=1 Tax=Shimazuella soli TaxID=1892854 RepID=UPI001F117BAC|nr:glycosyltransferase family protein [Shimazuella soli]MCH5586336.1 hypothetical protein [Shimazuella soli]